LRHSVQYTIGQYQLTINFWFLIVFLLVQTGLNELGYWQLSRAQEKQQRLEVIASNQNQVVTDLSLIGDAEINQFSNVELEIELASRKNILIENKIQNGKLGYHVVNLIQDVASRQYLLVNRGWVEGLANRTEVPKVELPASYWQVKARLYPVNSDVLSGDAEIEEFGNSIRVPVLDSSVLSGLEQLLAVEIKPYVLRIDAQDSHALAVDWAWVSMLPEKHLGYAFQWFALSLAFLIVSLFVLVKRVSSGPS
jgi:surfeit locus 1 family protein